MTYCSEYKSNESTALTDVYTFNGNSIYDPDAVAPGETDRGFTQMMTLYDRYVVTGSTIKVTAVNLSTDHVRTIAIIPTLQPSTTFTPMYYNGIKGQPYCVMKDLTPAAGSKSMVTLRNYMTTAKMFGLPKMTTTAITLYSGTAASNPTGTGLWFWQIVFLKSDVGFQHDIDYKVEMTHYVKFFQRKPTPL